MNGNVLLMPTYQLPIQVVGRSNGLPVAFTGDEMVLEPVVPWPAVIIGQGLVGAAGGALLMWQVGWAQESPGLRRQVGRGALFGAGLGVALGVLRVISERQQVVIHE